MSEHEFSANDSRCVHCGTSREHHAAKPQPCPKRLTSPSNLRPEPARRERSADDADTIHAEILKLRAAQEASWNVTIEEEVTG